MSKHISQGPSPDGPRASAARRRGRAISVATVIVVTLHGAVLWLLGSNAGPRAPWRPPRAPDALVRADPVPLTWVTALPPAVPSPATPLRRPDRASVPVPAVAASPPRSDRPAPAPRAAGAMPSMPRASRSAPAPDRASATAASSAPVTVAPADVPTAASSPDAPSTGASPAPARVPLQRSLGKEALRELSVGGRVWRDDPRLASKPSASVESRLSSGMGEAARGDCLRGEFKGGDMGLLSLPMMGLAAAQGRCRMP